jgi:hypothetical protein
MARLSFHGGRCADKIQASEQAPSITVQSFAVLKELKDFNMATVYIRYVYIAR